MSVMTPPASSTRVPRATKDVAQLALWHGRLDDHQKVVKHHGGRSRRRPRRAEGARARARGRGRWRSLRGTGTCGRRRSASALERFRRRGATRGETLRNAVPGEAVAVVRTTCSHRRTRDEFSSAPARQFELWSQRDARGERPARLTTRAPCPSCRTTALPSSVRLPPRARLSPRTRPTRRDRSWTRQSVPTGPFFCWIFRVDAAAPAAAPAQP